MKIKLPIAVFAVGITLTLLLSFGFYYQEREQTERDFDIHISHVIASIEDNIAIKVENLTGIRSFYYASKFVDADEFSTFIIPILETHQGISSIFEAEKVGDRFLVNYNSGNNLGLDLFTHPKIAPIAKHVLELQQTKRVMLERSFSDNTNENVLLTLIPVTKPDITGLIGMVVPIKQTIQDAIDNTKTDDDILFSVSTEDGNAPPKQLFASSAFDKSTFKRASISTKRTYYIADEAPLQVSAYKDSSQLPVLSLVGLAIGSLLTLILSLYSNAKYRELELAGSNDILEKLVSEQTKDLLESKEKAEHANRLKSEFLANMSHELRTPIHAVIAFSRIGIERIERWSPQEQAENLSKINESGTRLSGLLNNLLDLSKLESGNEIYDMAPRDLIAITNSVVGEIGIMAENKNIRINLSDSGEDYTAICDKLKIHQVILNLLSNAIKFTPDGKNIHITCTQENGKTKLSILDEGIGIPQDELDSVFDKFIQSSKTTTGAGGTGLGLAICKQIIEDHGGKIWAESNEGNGACFHILLNASA